MVKNPPARRSPGGGHGNPLQCSCLENPMDRGAWRATGHGVAKSQINSISIPREDNVLLMTSTRIINYSSRRKHKNI